MVMVASLKFAIDARAARQGAEEMKRAGETVVRSANEASQSVQRLDSSMIRWASNAKKTGAFSGNLGGVAPAIGGVNARDWSRDFDKKLRDAERSMARAETSTRRVRDGMRDMTDASGKAGRGILDLDSGMGKLSNRLASKFGIASGVFALGMAFKSVYDDAKRLNGELSGMTKAGQDLEAILASQRAMSAGGFAPSREDQIRAIMSQQSGIGAAALYDKTAGLASDAGNGWKKVALGIGDFFTGSKVGSSYSQARQEAEAILEQQRALLKSNRELEARNKLEQIHTGLLTAGQPTIREQIELEQQRSEKLRNQVRDLVAANPGIKDSKQAREALEIIDRNERAALRALQHPGEQRYGGVDPVAEALAAGREGPYRQRTSYIDDPSFPYHQYEAGADRYGRQAGGQEAMNRFSNLYDEGKRFVDLMSQSGHQGLTSFFDQIASGSVKAGDAISGLARSITADLMHALSEMAANRVMSAIFGGLGFAPQGGLVESTVGPGTGGGLDLPAPKLNALGNAFYKGSIVPHAAGGLISEPMYFPMAYGKLGSAGERYKKEAIVPLETMPGGKLGVNMSGAGGGGTNVVVHIHANDAGSFHRSKRQIADDMRRAVNG